MRSGRSMAANSTSKLLRELSKALEERRRGVGAWNEVYVKGLLKSLQTADGAATSSPLLTELSEAVDDLIKESDKQKEVFSKTRSELWCSLSAARVEEALTKSTAAEQKYREHINAMESANIVVDQVWKPLQGVHDSRPVAACQGVCLSPASVVATGQFIPALLDI